MPVDPLDAYKRAEKSFKRAADASARRFRNRMQQAVKRLRTAEQWAKLEMDRAKSDFEAELASRRAKLEGQLARLKESYPVPGQRKPERIDEREELSRITAEFQVELDRARAGFKDGYRRTSPHHAPEMARHVKNVVPKPPKRPRRRRRPDDGSEMAPVKPRPKPKPLMDGAEAPIE